MGGGFLLKKKFGFVFLEKGPFQQKGGAPIFPKRLSKGKFFPSLNLFFQTKQRGFFWKKPKPFSPKRDTPAKFLKFPPPHPIFSPPAKFKFLGPFQTPKKNSQGVKRGEKKGGGPPGMGGPPPLWFFGPPNRETPKFFGGAQPGFFFFFSQKKQKSKKKNFFPPTTRKNFGSGFFPRAAGNSQKKIFFFPRGGDPI